MIFIWFNNFNNLDYTNLPQELFYKYDSDWKINLNGYYQLLKQNSFAERMVNLFKYDEYAYIKEQLSWINLKFIESNVIKEVRDVDEMTQLYLYLKSIVGERVITWR